MAILKFSRVFRFSSSVLAVFFFFLKLNTKNIILLRVLTWGTTLKKLSTQAWSFLNKYAFSLSFLLWQEVMSCTHVLITITTQCAAVSNAMVCTWNLSYTVGLTIHAMLNLIIVYMCRPLKQHGQQRARWRHLRFLYHLNTSSLLARSHFLGLTAWLTFYSR